MIEIYKKLLTNNFEVNSKNIKDGDIFFALKGDHADGHDFVNEALCRGAKFAVVSKFNSQIDSDNNDRLICVNDPYETLVSCAKYNIDKIKSTNICITGSVGKTTTKEMVSFLLSKIYGNDEVFCSKKNYNSQIGLPICACQMPENTKIGIFEIGMSEPTNIQKLIKIVPPNIAIITHICEAHLLHFKNVFEIAKAKSEILESKGSTKIAILPADSPYYDFLYAKAKSHEIETILSFGFAEKADFRICEYNLFNDFIEIRACFGETVFTYKLYSSNIAAIYNSAIALLTVCITSNESIKSLAEIMKDFSLPDLRGRIFNLQKNGVTLVDDSYNACYTSVRLAIMSLSRYKQLRKIVVLGDMLELGDASVCYHENLSSTIDKFNIDKVFACGKLGKKLFNNLQEKRKGCWCENSNELFDAIQSQIENNDVILVKGSRGMKMNFISDELIKKFS